MELHHQSRTLDFGHYGPQRGKLSPRLLPSPAWLRLLPGGRAPGGWEIPAGHGGTLTRKIPGVESRSAPTTRIRSYNLIIHKDLDAPKFRRRNGQGAESTSQRPKSRRKKLIIFRAAEIRVDRRPAPGEQQLAGVGGEGERQDFVVQPAEALERPAVG